MKIVIPDLEKHTGKFVSFSEQVSLNTLGIDVTGNRDTVMTISVQASYLGDRVLVKGRWHVDLKDACSRCLEPTVYPLEEQFTEEFTRLHGSTPEASGDTEEPEGEDILYFSGDVLDLAEYLRQSFLLSQPLKILCRDDCRGLCPGCGVDRNKEECSCKVDKIDPRLRVLEGYKKKKPLQ